MNIRKPLHRGRLQTVIEGESMTHQSHAQSVDINHIVAQFDRSGYMPPASREAHYIDCTGLQTDLTQAHAESVRVIETANEYNEGVRKAKAKKAKADAEAPPAPDPADPPADS